MFITYMNAEDQRRDEGHRYAVHLAHRTEALVLWTAEEEDRRQLLACLHFVGHGRGASAIGACEGDGGRNGLG